MLVALTRELPSWALFPTALLVAFVGGNLVRFPAAAAARSNASLLQDAANATAVQRIPFRLAGGGLVLVSGFLLISSAWFAPVPGFGLSLAAVVLASLAGGAYLPGWVDDRPWGLAALTALLAVAGVFAGRLFATAVFPG